jgi:Na+-translocating ferredoxin:NAD+ oxidoreductase RnfE subunit
MSKSAVGIDAEDPNVGVLLGFCPRVASTNRSGRGLSQEADATAG